MKTMISKTLFILLVASTVGFFAVALFPTGAAFGEETVNINEMLATTPEEMPKDYTDEEIDQMLDDIQEIDETADTEGKEDSEAPVLSDSDRALVEDIRKHPEKYAEKIKEMEWLEAHPWVIWAILSDFVWIEAHPHFAARIYLNYGFWHRYPRIAYIIVLNRPFFVRYPRITFVVYSHDDWFILHPFCAREIYLNYVVFNRYPRLYERYYRHHEWIHRHPRIIRAAYGNRDLFRSQPHHLTYVYKSRREAVRTQIIRRPHLKKMHDRWVSNAPRPANHKNVKYDLNRPPAKDTDRGDSRHAERRYRDQDASKNRDLDRVKDRTTKRDGGKNPPDRQFKDRASESGRTGGADTNRGIKKPEREWKNDSSAVKGVDANRVIQNRKTRDWNSNMGRTRGIERNREFQRTPAGERGQLNSRPFNNNRGGSAPGGATQGGASTPGGRHGGRK